jgi:hypothetical protein
MPPPVTALSCRCRRIIRGEGVLEIEVSQNAVFMEPGSSRRSEALDECIGLIWSDRVNTAKSVGAVFVVVAAFAFSRRQSEQQSEQF